MGKIHRKIVAAGVCCLMTGMLTGCGSDTTKITEGMQLVETLDYQVSWVDTVKNVCYNDGESGKAHAADPKEFAAKGRRLCVDISHSRRSKTLDCAMLRGHSPFAD